VSEIRAILLRELVPSGKAATIGSLLKNGGYPSSLRAPSAGRMVVSWYHVRGGIHAGGMRKSVLVATARANFLTASTRTLRLRLTREGEQLLIGAKRLRLTARFTFTTTGVRAVTASRTFTLER
jgi:hypothetical protein